jgi:acyl-CoA thioesterase-1
LIAMLLRRSVFVLSLFLGVFPVNGFSATLLVWGDSLSAAYGMPIEQGWVALLQGRLDEKSSRQWQVINASISGQTSNGGRVRLSEVLEKVQPDIVLLGLGSNDGLQGKSLKNLQANLSDMVDMASLQDTQVLLLGSLIPPNYGAVYSNGFAKVYTDISTQQAIPLVPFLLEGVATDFDLMQGDGLHPTAEAQPRILENVWTHLEPML